MTLTLRGRELLNFQGSVYFSELPMKMNFLTISLETDATGQLRQEFQKSEGAEAERRICELISSNWLIFESYILPLLINYVII